MTDHRKMVNRLNKETSPYLQQHKANPVNWYPYSKEIFDIAAKEDKPLFISIGYSACHWCHVMSRESFSDNDTAKFMNQHFINIKIDREELPGVDRAYQEIFQLLHRSSGGWPLSVWAKPDGTPFFIGTYFPKERGFGLHSFMEINVKISEVWNNSRKHVEQQADELVNTLMNVNHYKYSISGELTDSIYQNEIISLQKRFDQRFGGIGNAPKFPRVSTLRFILHEGYATNNNDMVNFVLFSFHKMAKGGIYDQLGGVSQGIAWMKNGWSPILKR